MSEALLTLAAVEIRGSKVRLRRLVGQRFQDLHDALAPGGPFAAEGAAAASAPAGFRHHEPVRAVLCHGTAKISLDRQGLLKLLAFKGRQAERSSLALEQHEAAALLKDLKSKGQKLGAALGSLRAAPTPWRT